MIIIIAAITTLPVAAFPFLFRILEPPLCLLLDVLAGHEPRLFFGFVVFVCTPHFLIFAISKL
jgi:hypothetical protein